MEPNLDGTRVWVIGASAGIGAAVAAAAARAGAQLVVSARRAERLTDPAFLGATPVTLDVTAGVDAVAAATAATVRQLGGLDAVVTTVGASPLLQMSVATSDDWSQVLGTNVVGTALVAAATAPHLRLASGRFVALSSTAVHRPLPGLGLYATAKAALDGLLRCLPGEFPGIRVTRVEVGSTAGTEFARAWDPDRLDKTVEAWVAGGRLDSYETIQPEDVAATVLHVLGSPAHIPDIVVREPPGS